MKKMKNPKNKANLQIKITSRKLIKASNPSPPPSPSHIQVSNLDLVLGSFQVSLISIYPPTPPLHFPSLLSTINTSLPSFLNHFYPFAGRILADPITSLPSLVDNNAGAELVIAESSLPLSAIDFSDVDRSLNLIQLPFDSQLALSLQVVRFACGGFSLSWGTNHLLVDGNGLTAIHTAWSDFVRTGSLRETPNHDRSIFKPRSPPGYDPSLDREFTLYHPERLINVLSGGALIRRNYHVLVADVERLRAQASGAGIRATRLEAVSAHAWKLLATATARLDQTCRMAWLVDGRKRLGPKYKEAVKGYMGNVITYTSREARVEDIINQPLGNIATMVRSAIEEVSCEERFQQLVDWMEQKKLTGKWTETVGVGLGTPTIVVSSFLPFRVESDFGFGNPVLTLPWVRPGRLGSASFTIFKNPKKDGSLIVNARLWPRLAEVMADDKEVVFRSVTVQSLGLVMSPASRL